MNAFTFASRDAQSTYVVNESGMDCVEVRPVGCFYEGENMVVIGRCIDCGSASRNARCWPAEIATSSFQLAGLGAGDGRHKEQAQ